MSIRYVNQFQNHAFFNLISPFTTAHTRCLWCAYIHHLFSWSPALLIMVHLSNNVYPCQLGMHSSCLRRIAEGKWPLYPIDGILSSYAKWPPWYMYGLVHTRYEWKVSSDRWWTKKYVSVIHIYVINGGRDRPVFIFHISPLNALVYMI